MLSTLLYADSLNTLNPPEQSTGPIPVPADGEGKHDFSWWPVNIHPKLVW
jgi:hypothetical protein